MNTSYKSVKTLGTILVYVFYANIFFDFISLVIQALGVTTFSEVITTDVELTDGEAIYLLALVLVSFLQVLIFLVTTIIFIVWLGRAYSNLFALGITGMSYTTSWPYWCWFVPILNLFVPYKIVNETYHGCDPEQIGQEIIVTNSSGPGLHFAWWVLWIILGIIGNVTFRISMGAESVEMQLLATYIDIFATPFWMICALLAAWVVQEITVRQELFGARERSAFNAPPAPPVF